MVDQMIKQTKFLGITLSPQNNFAFYPDLINNHLIYGQPNSQVKYQITMIIIVTCFRFVKPCLHVLTNT